MEPVALLLLTAFTVLVVALVAIAWRRRVPTARRCADGAQEITICVCGCYVPDRFRARRGVPLRIHFERDDDADYAGRVFFPDFGVERPLSPGRTTTVELLPEHAGDFLFTSGEGRYTGVFQV